MSDLSDDTAVAERITTEIKRIGDDTQGKLKQLDESFRKDLHDARQLAEDARKAAGSNADEVKIYTDAQVKALSDSAVAKYEALETAFKKRLDDQNDEFRTVLNRRFASAVVEPDRTKARKEAIEFKRHRASVRGEMRPQDDFTNITDDQVDEVSTYAKHFALTYMRRDEKRWNDEEHKALTTGSDPDGGYLVPPATSNKIITRIWETSPLRQYASVEQIGSDRLEIPVDDDEAGMGWVGEEETRPETTTPVLRTVTILLGEQYAKPKVTQRLLEDAAIDLEGWLARKIAEKFARSEATAFITGNGVEKPRGILTYPAGTGRGFVKQVVTGAASTLTADSIVSLPFQILEPYLANARFLMKRSALAAVAIMKNTQDEYIWSDGLRGATGMSLVGYPVAFADDMPAVVAGSLSVAFGDFRAGYVVVDRLGLSTLRDPFSSKPFVEFYSRRRVGGDVLDFNAMVILKTAAA